MLSSVLIRHLTREKLQDAFNELKDRAVNKQPAWLLLDCEPPPRVKFEMYLAAETFVEQVCALRSEHPDFVLWLKIYRTFRPALWIALVLPVDHREIAPHVKLQIGWSEFAAIQSHHFNNDGRLLPELDETMRRFDRAVHDSVRGKIPEKKYTAYAVVGGRTELINCELQRSDSLSSRASIPAVLLPYLINRESLDEALWEILDLAEHVQTLELVVASPGGHGDANMPFLNVLDEICTWRPALRFKVKIYNSASAASVIAMEVPTVYREISQNGSMLFHHGCCLLRYQTEIYSGGVCEARLKEILAINERSMGILRGRVPSDLLAIAERGDDLILSSKQCHAYGLVDAIF